ncbi:MAG TPA: YqzL family protein [Pseudogracilibacillus sp.]|nr:YqzL family protein [Pseudogracilibacillus sp.]
MDNRMWNIFLETGNVEAYLKIKELERNEKTEKMSVHKSDMQIEIKR